jgi:tetratricopeptide (TPR) repeat protein
MIKVLLLTNYSFFVFSNCWECLADAYLARGAYISALKSYERALELNPDSFFSMIQLANIKLVSFIYFILLRIEL